MFGDRRLIAIVLIFAGLVACSTNPTPPSPVGPTPAPFMDITSRYMTRMATSPSDTISGQTTL